MEYTNEPDMTSRPRGPDGLHHCLMCADRLDNRVRAEPIREILDPRHALGHDVGCAELPRDIIAQYFHGKSCAPHILDKLNPPEIQFVVIPDAAFIPVDGWDAT